MRVDEIDLIGNFLIRGQLGGSSQGIGYSGSSIEWITVTSSGGGSNGPQGNTGPNVAGSGYKADSNQIVFSDGNPSTAVPFGLTSSQHFLYTHLSSTDRFNLHLGSSGSTTRTSTFSALLSVASASIQTSEFSAIVSSRNSDIFRSQNSVIIGNGIFNGFSYIDRSLNSVILGGKKNKLLNTENSMILSGANNVLTTGITNSIIIGGFSNSIMTAGVGGNNAAIIGGCVNMIRDGYIDNSVIIGGRSNRNCERSCNSIILGGNNNCIRESYNSAIIGGANNYFYDSCQSIIVGLTGANITDKQNTVIFGTLHIKEFSQFGLFTNATPENGDLWFNYSNNTMMFRNNGISYCLGCY
jgi:hypothetical protein